MRTATAATAARTGLATSFLLPRDATLSRVDVYARSSDGWPQLLALQLHAADPARTRGPPLAQCSAAEPVVDAAWYGCALTQPVAARAGQRLWLLLSAQGGAGEAQVDWFGGAAATQGEAAWEVRGSEWAPLEATLAFRALGC